MSRTLHEQTLTTGEVARHLGVNFRTVIRWIKKGHLKAYQLPGRGDNRIRATDFVEFLKLHKMKVPEEFSSETSRPKRVLIVENELPMARAIERVLESQSFDTQLAFDGFQAGALLPTYKPDLMTLDLSMPGISGNDVLKFVRGFEHLREIKILVISGRGEDELEEARKAGADDILQKPFENEILIGKIHQLIGVS